MTLKAAKEDVMKVRERQLLVKLLLLSGCRFVVSVRESERKRGSLRVRK